MAEEKKLIRFYKITSELGNMVYTGSTEQTLNQRFSDHKSSYNRHNDGKYRRTTSFDLFDKYGIDNCCINEISNKMCTKLESATYEQEYINQYKADARYVCVSTKQRLEYMGEHVSNVKKK